MAVLMHYIFAFPVGYLFPRESVTLLLKWAMLSDFLLMFTFLSGMDKAGVYAKWMKECPKATLDLIKYWQANNMWLKGVDLEPGENGFKGFDGALPAYEDATFSHSICFMALIAIPICVAYKLRGCCSRCTKSNRGSSWGFTFGVFLVVISHPFLDMFFHDAYFFFGNRAVTRVSMGLWRKLWYMPFVFVLEVVTTYAAYRLWLKPREPIDDTEETAGQIRKNTILFWCIGIFWNMVTWYTAWAQMMWNTPVFLLYVAPLLWTWTIVLWPMHRLEQLYKVKEDAIDLDYDPEEVSLKEAKN